MLMKQYPIIAAAMCAAALSTPACDDAEHVEVDGLVLASPEGVTPDDDAVDFRGDPGPPKAIYVTKWQGKTIGRAEAKQIIDACAKQVNPPQTCTLSWYQPDTTKPDFVLGLGCSMMATIPLLDCYRTAFLQNGAQGI